ncbi:unnamed protein product [Brugia pahangi]|uniref:Uncharacterized protein n=1 Tax=Brugia pahangi TaxID=6280 RepID=A0A0N4THD8_BRUPA|nr:unnamed protein product [Brugia pahangi]
MEMANVTINVAKFLNEPKLVIPRRMGILRNRCSNDDNDNDDNDDDDGDKNDSNEITLSDENDMINSNWSIEMDLIENYSISKNIYKSSFKQLNNTNQFCSLWYSVSVYFIIKFFFYKYFFLLNFDFVCLNFN